MRTGPDRKLQAGALDTVASPRLWNITGTPNVSRIGSKAEGREGPAYEVQGDPSSTVEGLPVWTRLTPRTTPWAL